MREGGVLPTDEAARAQATSGNLRKLSDALGGFEAVDSALRALGNWPCTVLVTFARFLVSFPLSAAMRLFCFQCCDTAGLNANWQSGNASDLTCLSSDFC